MRTWAKATLGGLAVVALAFAVLAGTGAYFVFRGMERRVSGEAEAVKEIDVVKTRFGQRSPLVEIVDPVRADIRINRPADASTVKVDTVHIMNWKREDGELMRTAVPLWLLRFSSVNVLSQLGLAPEKFRLTVSDIERYGPGIIVDYGSPGASRLLMWVD
jgi:hypothetical protein